MDEEKRYIELVSQAQHGDRESLDALAGLVRGRVYAYVYRIVLEEQSTQDIVQESMFEMFKILGKLEHTDRFWPWLRGIAFNKIRRHRLEKQRHKKQPLAGSRIAALAGADTETGLANLVAEELRQIVLSAMKELKPRHRKVLTMRCYEEMQYREIAGLMGCSELGVRMLFYRAKKSLERALSRKGLGKGFFVTALVLFGKMTAPSESAAAKVSLQAATLKVGAGATVLAIAGGKTAVVSLAAVGALAVGTMVATSGPGRKPDASLGSNMSITREIGSNGAKQEQWYYFSEGAAGPVMMRMMSTDAPDKPLYCAWRQNDRANYFYNRGKNTAFIESSRLWHRDLRVWRLPTDKPKLRQFLSKVEGRSEDMEYVRGEGKGLLVIARRGGAEGDNGWRQIYHRNILDEEYFRYNWPARVKVVDNRDAMHERGWTYFVIKGRVDGERVSGAGRIPFVYAASRRHRPWLRLKVGGGLEIVDDSRQALVYDERGKVVSSYAGGSFFKGLGRPWMGLHTIDTVRRDAAEQEVWFETKLAASGTAEVMLTAGQVELVYTIDMERDVIEEITISTGQGSKGELRFSYLQDIEQVGNEFTEPEIARRYGSLRRKSPGLLWLIDLATKLGGQDK